MKLLQGNIFTGVCQSFCSHGVGGEGCLPQCMLGYTHTPGQSRHPLRRQTLLGQTPPGSYTPTATTADGTHPTGMLSRSLGQHVLVECFLILETH